MVTIDNNYEWYSLIVANSDNFPWEVVFDNYFPN